MLRPIEGIDKIKVILNPLFLNTEIKKYHIDPKNELTLHKCGCFIALSIHAEFYNPILDFQQNLTLAIYELIKENIILFPDNIFTIPFIYKNITWFILYLNEVEFYFDIKVTNITMIETEDDNRLINYKGTYYSSDYRGKKRKSIAIIYNKAEKDKKDNHISHEDIDNYPFPIRLEFRLNRNNCQYLNLYNFSGTYKDIIKRFIPYLAIIYNVYLKDFIEVKGKANKYLGKIRKKAENNRVRYTGKTLRKSIPVAKNEYGKEQMQKMILSKFLRERKNEEKGIECE